MTPAINLLDKLGIDYRLRQYDAREQQRNYGKHAADKLNQNPQQVFKTLVTIVDGNLKKPLIGLVAVSDQLDLKKLAKAANARKAVMAETELAQRMTGYVIGGISPLGQRQRHKTFVDDRARHFDVVFVSGGKRGLQIELAPGDLIGAINASYAAISR